MLSTPIASTALAKYTKLINPHPSGRNPWMAPSDADAIELNKVSTPAIIRPNQAPEMPPGPSGSSSTISIINLRPGFMVPYANSLKSSFVSPLRA